MDLNDFFENTVGLLEKDLLRPVVDAAVVRKLPKKSLLVASGFPQTEFYFLADGIIRCYRNKKNGDELTEMFISQPGFPIIGNADPGNRTPGHSLFQAMTASVVVALPMDYVVELLDTNLEANRLYRKYAAQAYHYHQDLKYIRSHSASERFQWFALRYPELMNSELQNQYIASFLDMTPATYSRLLNKLHKEDPK